MTSIVSRRERGEGGETGPVTSLSCGQLVSSEPGVLGSGAEISSVLCPQGHPSVDHKTVLDS